MIPACLGRKAVISGQCRLLMLWTDGSYIGTQVPGSPTDKPRAGLGLDVSPTFTVELYRNAIVALVGVGVAAWA